MIRCPECKDRDVDLNDIMDLTAVYIYEYICYECSCEFTIVARKSTIVITREGDT